MRESAGFPRAMAGARPAPRDGRRGRGPAEMPRPCWRRARPTLRALAPGKAGTRTARRWSPCARSRAQPDRWLSGGSPRRSERREALRPIPPGAGPPPRGSGERFSRRASRHAIPLSSASAIRRSQDRLGKPSRRDRRVAEGSSPGGSWRRGSSGQDPEGPRRQIWAWRRSGARSISCPPRSVRSSPDWRKTSRAAGRPCWRLPCRRRRAWRRDPPKS